MNKLTRYNHFIKIGWSRRDGGPPFSDGHGAMRDGFRRAVQEILNYTNIVFEPIRTKTSESLKE